MGLEKQKAVNEEKILDTIKRLCQEARVLETKERKREFHFGADELEKEIGKIRKKLVDLCKILGSSETIKASVNIATFEIKVLKID